MKAMFREGPYQGVTMHVEEGLSYLFLPCVVRAGMKGEYDATPMAVRALYRLNTYNDVVAVYQFEGLKP